MVTSTATTALTNKECSPYGAHWTFDAHALSAGTARAVVTEGGRTWFFDQNQPDIGTGIARRWFDRDGMEMVTDLTNSAVALAVQALAREKHRVDLTADYTFVANLEATAAHEIERSGGKVLGHALAPLNTGDFA